MGSNPTPGTTGPKPTAGNVSCFPSKHPMEEAMQAVRKVTLEADSRITESIKWSTPTYCYQGNIFSFNPAKKFVSLLFHTGAQIPGDHPALEGDTETARVMRFADAEDVERRAGELVEVLRSWCEWKDEAAG